ncbi:uncharacterized protein LOC129730656 [Wyeomyia smithii]|uniref:uncharacterized protein LOC129730656 n=1 Tax=Wyeomyia smithii TaxID=174621 RepID=UPI002467B7F0|nr:uncharacterized protein LOC129730656 [Wyeomyia smithii]
MEGINTELFIDAVRKRTLLWDSSSTEFRDRTARARKWEEIAQLMIPNIHCMDPVERTDIIVELQKKWKHIRDAYIRSLRLRATPQGKNMRPYVYEKKLDFLKISSWKSSSEFESPRNGEDTLFDDETNDVKQEYCSEDDDDIVVPVQKMPEKLTLATFGVPASPPANVILDRVESDLCSFGGGESDDMLFFRSLLPLLETLPLRQKVKFRMDVMRTALQYSENASSSVIETPPSENIHGSRKRVGNSHDHSHPKKRKQVGTKKAALLEKCLRYTSK